jgi:hypothetical protein
MTEDELRKLQTIALKKFYLRFNYVSRRFISIKCLEDFKRNLRGFLAFSSFDKREI